MTVASFPANQLPYKPRVLCDTTVAAGAAVDTGHLDCRDLQALGIVMVNSDGAATRAPTIAFEEDDGTVILSSSPAAIAIGATVTYGVGSNATGNSVTTAWSIPVPAKIRITITAAGTSNCRVVVWGR